jgi:hypothetical protein
MDLVKGFDAMNERPRQKNIALAYGKIDTKFAAFVDAKIN